MTAPLRIGLVVPSGGPEADYYGFEDALKGHLRLYFTISRVGGESGHDHDLEALAETGQIEWIVEAASRLKSFGLNSISWACTSGSFISGLDFARKQTAALQDALGIPASSTSLAFIAALKALGLSRVSVLATYPEPASRAFEAFLGEAGIDVVSLNWLDAASGWDASTLDAEFICARAVEALAETAEVLLIPDTALPSLHFVEKLEKQINLPVLTANAVTLWHALQIADRPKPVPGYGSLLGMERAVFLSGED